MNRLEKGNGSSIGTENSITHFLVSDTIPCIEQTLTFLPEGQTFL